MNTPSIINIDCLSSYLYNYLILFTLTGKKIYVAFKTITKKIQFCGSNTTCLVLIGLLLKLLLSSTDLVYRVPPRLCG